MSQLVVKDERDYADRKNNYIGDDCSIIEGKLVIDSRLGAKSLELINSTSCNSSSSARISSRTVTGADDVVLFQVEAAHLRLMDSATVISTGSGSGKGLDFPLLALSVMGNDAHRVTSLNFLNILPSNQMVGEWINNLNSLVVEDDGGMKEYLIEDCTDKNSPYCGDHSTGESVIKEINVDKKADKEEAEDGKYIGARRSEELSIVHEEIFSRAREMRAA